MGPPYQKSPIPGTLSCFQELNVNFQSIILPESVAALQTQEPTVVAMVGDVCALVESSPIPIVELLDRLEIHLRCLVMGMESPHAEAQLHVAHLRKQLDALLGSAEKDAKGGLSKGGSDGDSTESALTAGQMLLMGFNGLFDKLQLQGQALANTLARIETPSSWRNVDHVRDAKSLAVSKVDLNLNCPKVFDEKITI